MVEKDVVEEQIMDFPDVHRVMVRRTEIAFVALQGERIGQLGRIVIVVARQAEGREASVSSPDGTSGKATYRSRPGRRLTP